VKKTDIRLPRCNETDKCSDLSNNLGAFDRVKQIIELSMAQLDSGVQVPQGIDVNSANRSEILGGKSCPINCNMVAIEVDNDCLCEQKRCNQGLYCLFRICIVFWMADHAKHLC